VQSLQKAGKRQPHSERPSDETEGDSGAGDSDADSTDDTEKKKTKTKTNPRAIRFYREVRFCFFKVDVFFEDE
jgi:hypothetical protein